MSRVAVECASVQQGRLRFEDDNGEAKYEAYNHAQLRIQTALLKKILNC